jgi:hypothetical protein
MILRLVRGASSSGLVIRGAIYEVVTAQHHDRLTHDGEEVAFTVVVTARKISNSFSSSTRVFRRIFENGFNKYLSKQR